MPSLIGTGPNQVSTNSNLGRMAFQDPLSVNIDGGTIDGTIIGSIVPSSATFTSMNTGQLAGLRNKIANGDFRLASNGTSFAASGNLILDGWTYNNNSTAVVTISQDPFVISAPYTEFRYSLKVLVTTADSSVASGEFNTIRCYIHGADIYALVGTPFTLSFWVYSSTPGLQAIAFRNAAADRSYIGEYTIIAANTWEKKTIVVTGGFPTSGTWSYTSANAVTIDFILLGASNLATAPNIWTTGSFIQTNNGGVNNLAVINNVFALTGVQLEIGSVATPFESRPFYLERLLAGSGGYGATGGAGGTAFYENDITISSNYTITTGKNAMSAGPITINDSITVTVPTGSIWSIV